MDNTESITSTMIRALRHIVIKEDLNFAPPTKKQIDTLRMLVDAGLNDRKNRKPVLQYVVGFEFASTKQLTSCWFNTLIGFLAGVEGYNDEGKKIIPLSQQGKEFLLMCEDIVVGTIFDPHQILPVDVQEEI